MSRSMRRSRKIRKQSDDGCLLAFFPIIIVLGVIVGVAQFVAENIGVIFIVLLVVGAIVGLIVAINNFFQKGKRQMQNVNAILKLQIYWKWNLL